MPFTISLRPSSGSGNSGSRGPVISLPIGLGPTGSGAASNLDDKTSQQALAAAVAGALDDVGEAADLAKLADEHPGQVAANPPDSALVKRLRDAIKAAQDDPALTYDQDEKTRSVASAVGANPRLAAAATAGIKAIRDAGLGDGGEAARRWALALLSPPVLERAAQAANKAIALEGTSTTPAQISQMSATVEALKKQAEDFQKQFEAFKTAVAKDIVDLKQMAQVNATDIARNETAVVKIQREIDTLKGGVKGAKGP